MSLLILKPCFNAIPCNSLTLPLFEKTMSLVKLIGRDRHPMLVCIPNTPLHIFKYDSGQTYHQQQKQPGYNKINLFDLQLQQSSQQKRFSSVKPLSRQNRFHYLEYQVNYACRIVIGNYFNRESLDGHKASYRLKYQYKINKSYCI